MNKLSNFVGAGSIFWIVIATIRWFFIWTDYSNWLFAMMFGVGGVIIAYEYHQRKCIEKKVDYLNGRVDALLREWTKEEFK